MMDWPIRWGDPLPYRRERARMQTRSVVHCLMVEHTLMSSDRSILSSGTRIDCCRFQNDNMEQVTTEIKRRDSMTRTTVFRWNRLQRIYCPNL